MKKPSQHMLISIIILIIWELLLLLTKSSWVNFILLPCGAIVGYAVMEIEWFFPKKEVLRILPLILLPLTLFVITSTSGILGKSIIVFLNLRLLLDKKILSKDN